MKEQQQEEEEEGHLYNDIGKIGNENKELASFKNRFFCSLFI
jgi:hypothetical protein